MAADKAEKLERIPESNEFHLEQTNTYQMKIENNKSFTNSDEQNSRNSPE